MTTRRRIRRRESPASTLSNRTGGSMEPSEADYSDLEELEGADSEGQGQDTQPESVTSMVEAFQAATGTQPRVSRTAPSAPSQGLSEGEDLNPQSRMAQIAAEAPEYSREHRLSMVHRLLLRKISLDEIARQFGVDVRTIQRDRQEIFRRMRVEAGDMEANGLVGEAMGFYNEIIGMALRVATLQKNPLPSRLAAMRTAMQGKKETFQTLSAAGVFDVLRFKTAEEGGNTDLSRLVELTEKVMAEEDLDELMDDSGDMDSMLELEEQEVRLI